MIDKFRGNCHNVYASGFWLNQALKYQIFADFKKLENGMFLLPVEFSRVRRKN